MLTNFRYAAIGAVTVKYEGFKYDIFKWYIWYSGGDPPPKKNFHAYKQFGRSLGGSSVSNTLGSFLPPVI